MSNRLAGDRQDDTGRRFDDLFNSHSVSIHRYCARRLGRFDAEDAAADVFAVAWRRLNEMPEGDASRAWLFGVAYRVVGNLYRTRRRRARLNQRLAVMGDRSVLVRTDQSEAENIDLILVAMDQLSAVDAELLRLSAWDGLTRSEVAYVLRIKENAVDQRLHRARSRLKSHFDRLAAVTPTPEPKEASA